MRVLALATLALIAAPAAALEGIGSKTPPAGGPALDGSAAADQVAVVTKDGSHLPPAGGSGPTIADGSASADQTFVATKDGSHLPPGGGNDPTIADGSASADQSPIAHKPTQLQIRLAARGGTKFALVAEREDGSSELVALGVTPSGAAATSGAVPGAIVVPHNPPSISSSGSSPTSDPLFNPIILVPGGGASPSGASPTTDPLFNAIILVPGGGANPSGASPTTDPLFSPIILVPGGGVSASGAAATTEALPPNSLILPPVPVERGLSHRLFIETPNGQTGILQFKK